MRGTMRRLIVWSLLAATMAFAVAACGSDDNNSSSSSSTPATSTSAAAPAQPGKGKPPVTIGTKDFTEEFILGQLYAQALKAKGYKVNLKSNIGATEITDKAMTSGKIDAYPEYTGETVATVFGKSLKTPTAATTTATAKALYAKRGQVTSTATPFEDVDAIAASKAYAQKNGLSSVADLKKLKSFTLGARPEFKDRAQGLKGMKDVYGINNAKFVQLAQGLTYRALDKGDVDTINVFSTDPQIASGKYKILTDPKGVFGRQNVMFVINRPKYVKLGGPRFMAIINKVNSLLTQNAITSMNAAVALDKKDPAAVAGAFLKANGLG
jgi:osmoprotectant transport system substrate-binding protein